MAKHVGLTREQLLKLMVAGFKGAFFPGSYNDKTTFVKSLAARFLTFEPEMLPALSKLPAGR